MRPVLMLLAGALAVLGVVLARRPAPADRSPVHHHAPGPEVSPVCPWREPLADLAVLFPPATNFRVESRILSHHTVELERRLGRHLGPDDNPLRIHRVRHQGGLLGSVLVTRVRGQHGAVELVIGVQTNGQIRGVLLQSHREPDDVLGDRAFLDALRGRAAGAALQLGGDLPDVPELARPTVAAVVAGVRDQLLLLSFAEADSSARPIGGLSPAP